MTSRFVDMRKLVALDILLHGRPLILAEVGIGTLVAIALGLQLIDLSLLVGNVIGLVGGSYLTLIGLNYLPFLVYAVIISKKNSAENEAESELQHKSKYNEQQFLILVPLLTFLIIVAQELEGHGAPKS
jgi:hypothetical protein